MVVNIESYYAQHIQYAVAPMAYAYTSWDYKLSVRCRIAEGGIVTCWGVLRKPKKHHKLGKCVNRIRLYGAEIGVHSNITSVYQDFSGYVSIDGWLLQIKSNDGGLIPCGKGK